MKKKWIVILSLAAVCVLAAQAAVLGALLPRWLHPYTVNEADVSTRQAVPAALRLYSKKELGFSFLYPAQTRAAWSARDGAYLYGGETDGAPYVLVCRAQKRGMNPARYFRGCDKLMLQSFERVESTPIQELRVGGKTLYLTRYVCGGAGTSLVIDRYLELYKDSYIQYTAVSDTADSLNTPLYYAITTLRLREGAYEGAYSDAVKRFESPETGLRVDVPEMFELRELTIGCFAAREELGALCARCVSGAEFR